MFVNKKIIILGFSKSGYEAAKYLTDKNEVTLTDIKEDHDISKINELKKLNVNLILGSHPDDLINKDVDYLIKNPGVPINHKYVLMANDLKIPVINEVELAYLELPKDVKIVAITGTNGKTTTTSLIYEILKKKYKDNVHLGGNIGIPFISLLNVIKPKDILVIEISVQQLENLHKFKPDIGVLTNLSEAHLEFFPSFEHYINNKIKLFQVFDEESIAIINNKDNLVVEKTKNIKGKKIVFADDDSSYLQGNEIYYNNDLLISRDELLIKGDHNILNILAALKVAEIFQVEKDEMKDVLTHFKGVAHRLEKVPTVKYEFYNDSQATNIECTITALKSFDKDIILFLGGYERGQDFNELKPYIKNIKHIIGIGTTEKRVEEFAKNNNISYIEGNTLKEGFGKLQNIIEEQDIVLLSPASASWDQYTSADVRGDEFKELAIQFGGKV